MKRIRILFSAVLILILSLLFMACSQDGNSNTNDHENNETEAITFSLNEDDNTYKVVSVISNNQDSISIPETYKGKPVSIIGNEAFAETNYTEIIIPNTVTSIEDKAFYFCRQLRNINIPLNLRSIGKFAFSGCSLLSEINIPKTVNEIGYNAFQLCKNLKAITVDENNSFYSSDGNNLYNKAKTIIIQYAVGQNNSEFTILDSVRQIGAYSFANCTNLKFLYMSDNVTAIGDDAFSGCNNLKDIQLSKNLVRIGSSAFAVCMSFEEIVLPQSVGSIGALAFSNCTSLKSIHIPKLIKQIEDYAFYKCDLLTNVYFEGSETEWGQISIGKNNDPLKIAKVEFNSTNTDNGNDNGEIDENSPFYFQLSEDKMSYTLTGVKNTDLSEIIIPDNYNGLPISSISAGALYPCKSVSKISLPFLGKSNSANNMYDQIFGYIFGYSFYSVSYENSSSGIKSETAYVGIPNTTLITEYSQYVYKDIDNKTTEYYNYIVPNTLREIEIRNGNVSRMAFYGCGSITKISLPNDITIIEQSAFEDCDSLSQLSLPLSLQSIKNNAFTGCSSLMEIIYLGSSSQWLNINKEQFWNYNYSDWGGNDYFYDFLIKCSDGNISSLG